MKRYTLRKILAVLMIMGMVAGCLSGCESLGGGGGQTVLPDDGQNVTGTEGEGGEDAQQGNNKKPETGKTGYNKNNTGKTDNKNNTSSTGTSNTGSTGSSASGTGNAVVFAPEVQKTYSENSSRSNDITDINLKFKDDGSFKFSEDSTFYSNDLNFTITAPEGATVYYTLDGRMPTTESTVYDGPIEFAAHGGSFPPAYIFRAMAVYADGTVSETAARTFLVSSKLDGRFTTVVFSISGDPDELTLEPDGIFTGKNYEQRGRESEREVYVEAWKSDGTEIFSQFAGVRIYGGYSRQTTIKSMKLFSRKSYDADHKNFLMDDFGTFKLDGSNNLMAKYDKLVLRNYGNDMQFGFIRDELNQKLCQLAGFDVYEEVIPAVAYLNGEYYGFYWLHENYSDKYFKEKFGDAEGEFVILEGTDTEKSDDDDPLTQKYVEEYNNAYNKFINMDLTSDANYKQVTDFMDVESYLDFFAWNIAIGNWDWPNNNFKCVRYVEASAEQLAAEGAAVTPDNEYYDGRWRFLPHDMDFSFGLYGNTNTQAKYDTLKVVLNENDERYSPLFAKLMERDDCRIYFREKTIEFCEGALSEESIISTYESLHATRAEELSYFYKYIEQRARKGDSTMWTTESLYAGNEAQIYDFAKWRARYCLVQMDSLLPDPNAPAPEETEGGEAEESYVSWVGDNEEYQMQGGGAGQFGAMDWSQMGDIDWENIDWSQFEGMDWSQFGY